MKTKRNGDLNAAKIIALNSYVEVHDLNKDARYTLRLVQPSQVNVTSKWISIHSPLGKTLMGKQTGDTVTWTSPTETQTLKILRVRHN